MTDKPDTNPEDAAATGTQPGQKAEAKMFSQEDVNRIMGETRRDATNAAVKKLLQELGYEDGDQLKASLTKLQELDTASKSETQRLQEAVERAQKQLAETQTQLAQEAKDRIETQIRSDVIAEASKRNFNDPMDGYRNIDLSAIRLNAETGQVEGIVEALDGLSEQKPYLLKQGAPRIAPTNPGKTEPKGETPEQRRARLFGQGKPPFGSAQGGGVWYNEKEQ